jgi:hypothetical protein
VGSREGEDEAVGDESDQEAVLDCGGAVLRVLKPFVEFDRNRHVVTSGGAGWDDRLWLQNPA